MRILVVEDEPKMAALVRRALEREGIACDLAVDGNEALWSAREVTDSKESGMDQEIVSGSRVR